MEFKGSKGRYHMPCGTTEGTIQCLPSNVVFVGKIPIAKIYGNTIEEATANTVLFKHAPEMLDFINRISGEMLRSDFVLNEKWYDQAQQLIKSATEI